MKHIIACILILMSCGNNFSIDPELIVEERTELEEAIHRCAFLFGVEEKLIRAIIKKESDFQPMVMRFEPGLMNEEWYLDLLTDSEKTKKIYYSSIGYMQVLYGSAKIMGYRGTPHGLLDVNVNLSYGTKYLSKLLGRYKKIDDAVSAYNAGLPRKNADGTYRNQAYVDAVMRNYRSR